MFRASRLHIALTLHLRSAVHLSSRLAVTAILATVPACLAAQNAQPPWLDVLEALPGSTLTIRGSTTIGARWSCRATGIEARVAVAGAPLHTSPIPDVRGVSIHVWVSALRCQSTLMERSMRHAMRADRDTAAQYIRGLFEIYDDVRPEHPGEAHLAGALRVAGVERNVFLRARVTPQPGGALHVESVVPMTLSAFAIEPPRVLWGAVRARDAITVEVNLRFPAPSVAKSLHHHDAASGQVRRAPSGDVLAAFPEERL